MNIKPVFPQSERIFGLDLLRATAIIFVLVDHCLLLTPSFQQQEFIRLYFGTLGVEIFFSLSGFLIGTILLKTVSGNKPFNGMARWTFWKRRWLRTLPAYLFFFLVYLIVSAATQYQEFGKISFFKVVPVLFFSQNIFFITSSFFPVAWSLSIEEWFYLLLPIVVSLIIPLIKIAAGKSFVIAAAVVIATAFVSRLCFFFLMQSAAFATWLHFNVHTFPIRAFADMRKIVVLRLDAAVYGVILSYAHFFFKEKTLALKKILLAFGALFLAAACLLYFFVLREHLNIYSFLLTFPTFGIGFALCLPFFIYLRAFKGTLFRVIQSVSVLSYSIYLSHFPIMLVIRHNIGHPSWAIAIGMILLLLTLTFFISVWSYNNIERWGMLLRNKRNQVVVTA